MQLHRIVGELPTGLEDKKCPPWVIRDQNATVPVRPELGVKQT